MGKNKLSTGNYKGTRDFYPEDMRFRQWMFATMRNVVESYGYGEYDAPILESFELYSAKTGQEIVQNQLYDFEDKSGRHVAIRPEMTPSLARMVAARARELPRPIRWYSIPNLWRYEAPGRGRLREHWQLNVDIFGVNHYRAEVEILQLACDILFAFGAPTSSFAVKVSDRRILNSFFSQTLQLSEEQAQPLAKLLDKKHKIKDAEFNSEIQQILPDYENKKADIDAYLRANLNSIEKIKGIDTRAVADLRAIIGELESLQLDAKIQFDPAIIRGFDYYTGFIFEIFDTDPQNRRSLYGGGRYDNLTGLFTNDALSGIGFGLGDVTLENFLQSHNLLAKLDNHDTLYMPLLADEHFLHISRLARQMRREGIPVEIGLEGKHKLKKQFQNAEKKGYRYLVILGEDEIELGLVTLKDLITGKQNQLKEEDFVDEILGKFHS